MSKTTFPKLRGEAEHCETLYLAIEISDKSWLLGFATPGVQNTRVRSIGSDCEEKLLEEIEKSRERFGLPADCRVVVAYEAGFSGFWLARELQSRGIEVLVLPSTILEDTGPKRRRKTDQIDVRDLVSVLIRYDYYEDRKLFHPVAVPTVEIEDACRIHRERTVLKREIGQHRNRIRGLLRLAGKRPNWKNRANPIPEGLAPRCDSQIRRELQRLRLAQDQLKEVETEQREALLGEDTDAAKVARLMQCLVGIGTQGGWELAHEVFWRPFRNRRQVGAFAGLTTVPYQSGTSCRDGAISKRGNKRVRALLVELAWLWLRYQPNSRITKWYMRKFVGKRPRKVGIVALARKLLIELWQFVRLGVVPEGARFKVPKPSAA